MKWQPVTLREGTVRHWQIGPCKLWVRRTPDEWQTYVERDPLSPNVEVWSSELDVPDEVNWTRWAAVPHDYTLRVQPALPERPVIVRPESPFMFPPGSNLTFFISVPIWLNISTGADRPQLLCEEPTVILSNSFFGEPTTGQLGYALKTTARRHRAELRQQPHLAACPIHIHNPSAATVSFERLCIHARHLHILQGEDRLWTSKVNVTFKGETGEQQLAYPAQTVDAAGETTSLTPAREPAPQGRFQKPLAVLKTFIA